MATIGNLVDLLLFYRAERELFNRMVCVMGKSSQLVKKSIALWLMLEEIGYHDLIRVIYSHDNKTIEAFFNEALKCLECIKPNAAEPTLLDDATPAVFQGLLDDPLSRRFFYYNREFMYKRYIHIMETVCSKIFGEAAAIEVDESGMRPVVGPAGQLFGQGRSSSSGVAVATEINSTEPAGGSEAATESNLLNPDASEFYPEDARTMFLTFSKGYPLTRQEIIYFFTSKWGEVVQDVFIEHPRPGEDPLFGRIVFTTSTVIAKVLNGQSKAKFLVNRKHLWARIYVNRHGNQGKRIR